MCSKCCGDALVDNVWLPIVWKMSRWMIYWLQLEMSRCYINSAIPNLHDKKRTSSSCESKTHQAKGTNVGQEILGWGTVKGLQWLIERSARMTNHTCVFPVFLSPSEAAQSYDTWRQTNTLADTKLEYEKGGCNTYSITEHVSSHHSIISTLILYNNDIIMLWHWATQMTQQQSILCYIWRILSCNKRLPKWLF